MTSFMIISLAGVVGLILVLVGSVLALTWLLLTSRRVDEQSELIEAWSELLFIVTGLSEMVDDHGVS